MSWSRKIQVPVIAILTLAGTCTGSESMEHIGGGWSIVSVPRAPEAGIHPRNLVRTSGTRRVIVDELIEQSRFYGPDCVIYQTARAHHHVFAVCGDRVPIAIGSSMVDAWKFEADGPRRTLPPDLRHGKLVQTSELLPIEQVRAVAMRQPLFTDGARAEPWDQKSSPVRPQVVEVPVDFRSAPSRGTPLLIDAVIAGRLEMIDALLSAGVDVNGTDALGKTPLIFAAGNRHLEIVDRLISAGANVNAQDKSGETPLMAAANVGEKEIVKRLLDAGADAAIRDAKGRTAAERIPSAQDAEMLDLLRNAARHKSK